MRNVLIKTDVSVLSHREGYISGRDITYNSHPDVCVIDSDKIAGFSKSAEQYFIDQYVHEVEANLCRGLIGSKLENAIRPFELHYSVEQDASKFENDVFLSEVTDIVSNCFRPEHIAGSQIISSDYSLYAYKTADKKIPIALVDIQKTIDSLGVTDTEFVELILEAVSDSKTPRKISKVKGKFPDYIFTEQEFRSSPFFKVYSNLVFKLDVGSRKHVYHYKGGGYNELFDQFYFHGDTHMFQSYVYRVRSLLCEIIEYLTTINGVFVPYSKAGTFIGEAAPVAYHNGHNSTLFNEVDLAIKHRPNDLARKSNIRRFLKGMRCSSNINTIADMPELLCVDYKLHMKNDVKKTEEPSKALKAILESLESNSDWLNNDNYKSFNIAALDKKNLQRISEGDFTRTSPTLRRYEGVLDDGLLDEFRLYTLTKSNSQTMRQFNVFLDYLIEFNKRTDRPIRSIQDLNITHFHHPLSEDVFCFREFMASSERNEITRRNVWSQVRKTLASIISQKVVDGWSNMNPMPEATVVYGRSGSKNKNVTVRDSMPSELFNCCLEALTEDDYQLVKDAVPSQTTRLYNYLTDEYEAVFMPNLAHIMHLMMLLPLRGHQARWLDEGLSDSEIWDLEANRYVPNTSPLVNYKYPDGQTHEEKFGKTSVIQSSQRSGLDNLSLYICTNKTKSYTLQKKGHTGYSIPWVADSGIENVDEVIQIIKRQKKFNDKYSPKDLIPVRTVDEDKGKYSEAIFDQLPRFTPLFRDVSQRKVSAIDPLSGVMYFPPTAAILRNLFRTVLKSGEDKYKEKYPSYKNQIVAFNEDGEALFDLHGLRVFGITDLLNQGMDKEIVKLLVGHNTSIMTLYYRKLGEKEYKRLLLEAKKKAGVTYETEMNQLGKSGVRGGDLIDNSLLDDDFKDVMPDFSQGGCPRFLKGGVCLSFDCNTGGVRITYSSTGSKKSEVISVEGGAMRCGNCRYWKSGPRFIAEQIFYMNDCAEDVRKLSLERVEIYQKINDAYEQHSNPDLIIKRLSEKADRKTELLVARMTELRRRQKMYEASLSQMKLEPETLPILFGESSSVYPSLEDLNLLDSNMELSMQALMLGLDTDESQVYVNKLDGFLNKVFNETDVKNPLLYVPSDDVKRAAILYTAAHTKELLGSPITDEEFQDPRLIFTNPEKAILILEGFRSFDAAKEMRSLNG
ncbi:VPA1269 family protein [Photobacterium sp. J15]|uniref:VPA1269 family protein n=1 Tax=Photobacterium sp. J15 TaxID=265901 RepID=UPI0007E320E3|nr:VPA1269 family protein [Photobacterium sp. J15]